MFQDRIDAGARLGAALAGRGLRGAVVLAIPRGGAPVAAGVATALGAPLDVVVVHKIGVPYGPEVPMVAVAERRVVVADTELVRRARVGPEELIDAEERQHAAVAARAAELRQGRDPVPLAGRVAIVVDDGVATGSTARAACLAARAAGASRVLVAAPVVPTRLTAAMLDADELVGLERPTIFRAVEQVYRDFRPVSDHEVSELIAEHAPSNCSSGAGVVEGSAVRRTERRPHERRGS